MAEWLIVSSGRQSGPVSDAQLRQMAAAGELKPTDHLWREGLDAWVPATRIKGLFPEAHRSVPAGAQATATSAAARPAPTRPGATPPPAPAARGPVAVNLSASPVPPGIAAARPAHGPQPHAAGPAPGAPMPYAARPMAVAFNVVVSSTDKSVPKGVYKLQFEPGGILLTRKNKPSLQIPVGAQISYPGKNKFTAVAAGRAITLSITHQTRYTHRLTRDLVAHLRGQGPAPVLSNYALEWYFYVAIFMPLGIILLTLGGAVWMVFAGFATMLCGFISQRETMNKWLRLGLMLAINGVLYLTVITLLILVALQHMKKAAGGGVSPTLAVVPETPRAARGGNSAPQQAAPDLASRGTGDAPPAPVTAPAWRSTAGVSDLFKGASVSSFNGVRHYSSTSPLTAGSSSKTPVAFRVQLVPGKGDVKLTYADTSLVFNARKNPDELRVEGGPAAGKNKPGAGALPRDQWVAIEWVIKANEMTVYVEGQERHRASGNFARADSKLTLATSSGRVYVREFSAARP